jgi:hypothetical protein
MKTCQSNLSIWRDWPSLALSAVLLHCWLINCQSKLVDTFTSVNKTCRMKTCHIKFVAYTHVYLANKTCHIKACQSVSKVLGQMPQNLWISTNVNPPAPWSMLCPISRQVWCVLVGATLIGVGGGGGERYCVQKTVMIHLQSKTTCVPTTSESDCLGPICHNTIVYLNSTGYRMLCERSISAPFRSQKI